MTVIITKREVIVDVERGDALILRDHVRSCVVCSAFRRPTCAEAMTLVEGALSMAGLYSLDRSRKERAP